MNNLITPYGSVNLVEDDPVDISFSSEVASWAKQIEEGANTGSLSQLLDNIDEAFLDPEKRKELEAQGISEEFVASLREGLNNPMEEYDPRAWNALFGGLAKIGGPGSFGLDSLARLNLLSLNVHFSATELENYHQAVHNQEIIENVAVNIMELGNNSEGDVALTPEMVASLIEAGLTPEDVSDPKLKALLEGADPATILFSPEELKSASKELSAVGLEKIEGTESELLLSLKKSINLRIEAFTLISNIEAKKHEAAMQAVNRIGNA